MVCNASSLAASQFKSSPCTGKWIVDFDRHVGKTKLLTGDDAMRSIRHAKHVGSTDYDLDWRERHALSHQFGEQREKEDGVAL